MKNSICKKDITLKDLLKAINEEPAGIAFVTDDKSRLCGVVTDGDFRRMLLSGHSLNDSLETIELGDFVYAKAGENLDKLMSIANKKVRIIPIVNEQMQVVDYFRYDNRIHIPVTSPDLDGNELKYLTDAFLSTWISSTGTYITRFEKEFSEFCTTKYGVATSNGTTAIHLALLALGIGPGDEVIVPDLTFAATINTVLHAGATPVIVDVEQDSWCIDPAEIKKAITPRTKAIIPVHLYGQPCSMNEIMAIAKEHKLYVIEDCAEAHGAEYEGKKVGSFGDIACFSFYGNKIVTTGEGGMCLTSSAELDEKMRVLRDHGMNKKKRYWHDVVGYNYRMTNLQAAIGCAQLERIDRILKEREEIESQYYQSLKHLSAIEWQPHIPGRTRVVWLVNILIKNKPVPEIIEKMKEAAIDVRPFFYPLSEMDIYKKYVFSVKNSLALSRSGLSLPTMKNLDYKRIGEAMSRILG